MFIAETIANIVSTLIQIFFALCVMYYFLRSGMYFAIIIINEVNTDKDGEYNGIMAIIMGWMRRLFLRELDKFEPDVIKTVFRIEP